MEEKSDMGKVIFKRVCVFCGSSTGKRDSYREAALELGKELVSNNLDLVYGGGSIGLMGIVSAELTGETIGEVRPVANMHQRKAEMAQHSDCFIALPGGYGTMEELMEVVTWAQLGIHDKPIGLLNVDGYYDSFLKFIDHAVEEEFITPSQRHIIVSAPTALQLIQKLQEYTRVHGAVAKAKWEVEQVELNSIQPEIAR
ncbi:hypothetical protein F511_00955 [Dorcoceras hygrometricum]|uniref:Cytokinin riboside 5'-monophosphate phosphoribohydrolase n=1 Tax=Dorcoceras hygrometricum TaxID=472368 RepID=A0A2Z7AEQ9_9LAMI|nr:hypothetical protein F511_00955 [Dorcoceras hygrometricum]